MSISVEAIPYTAFPCMMKSFRVNNIVADKYDFGYTEDIGWINAELGGCGNKVFTRDKHPTTKILAKYGITEEEWNNVCDTLEKVLCIGKCNLCVYWREVQQ